MSKIKIDTDKIENTSLPLSRKVYSYNVFAKNYAAKVNFSSGEFDWGNVYNKIDDCMDKIEHYTKWIDSINRSVISCVTDSLEDISAVKVEEITVKDIAVK